MAILTIFTPTYNRAYCLGQLYESLKKQTSKDFCWLIVDDGSTDDTKELVKSWIDNKTIDIHYYWQENGGKMRAHNYGTQQAQSELFLCCDSDDYLTDNAVEKILKRWNDYPESRDHLNGIIGPKLVYKNGERMINKIPQEKFPMTIYDFGHKRGVVKETYLVFVTSIIRKYPFPVQEGEKFISESFIYNQLDDSYKMLPLEEELMICHYLEDGYSMSNGINRMFMNPKSLALVKNDVAYRRRWSRRGLAAVRDYIVLSFIANKNVIYIIKTSKTKLLTLIMLPNAIIKYTKLIRKRIQYTKQ